MQVILNGLVSGATISLLAIAFQIVYLPTRVFFMALAGIHVVAPFLAYAVLRTGGPAVLAIAVALGGGVVVSGLCEWSSHARLARRQASGGVHLVASLGMYLVLVQVVAIVWGYGTKTLRTGIDSVTMLGPITIAGAQWVTLLTAMTLVGAFSLFLMRSNVGLRLVALSDNPTAFALLGYDIGRYRLIAFMLAGLLASAAALASAYDTGFNPSGGLRAVLLAIVAVVVGGQGSFFAPVIGGLLLGVLRAAVLWHWSARWEEAATFALLAVLLLIRPQGLLGTQTRLEAAA